MSDEMFLDYEEDEDTQANRFLTFSLGNETYAVEIRYIVEIIEIQRISEVPDMPAYVKGVINLRGSIIPVVDMRSRFSIPEREYDDRTCIVIVMTRETRIGLIVDTVHETVTISPENISPPPKFRESSQNRYISGIGRIGEKVEIIIDVERVLYEELTEAAAGAVEAEAARS